MTAWSSLHPDAAGPCSCSAKQRAAVSSLHRPDPSAGRAQDGVDARAETPGHSGQLI